MLSKPFKIFVILSLLTLYCFVFQGNRGLFDPDEGRYSAIALQMIKYNDWIHPHTHPDQAHWTKPPLTYWAIASSLLVFGMNEFAVRFPNVLSFFISIIACFYMGKIFTPKRPWLVPLVFATFLFPATVCNGATTDYIMTMWNTLAVCLFAHAYWGPRKGPRYLWLMWIAFGLAFLTKGTPGLLSLLCIIVFLQFKNVKVKNFSMHWRQGLLLMILIGGSWFFVVIANKTGLLQYYFWEELILRFFTDHHQRHPKWYSFLYIYAPVLILGSLPWGFFLFKGLSREIKAVIQKVPLDIHTEQSQSLFLVLWFLIPLTVFSFSRSNLPLYMLPLFVPLAIITARAMETLRFEPRKLRYAIAAWCLMIVFVRPVMGSVDFRKDASRLAQELNQRHPYPVDEILFVNALPALGLQFYTGSDIKSVPLEQALLADELKNESSTRLWLVLETKAKQFRKEAGSLNIAMRDLGPISERQDYVLFTESRTPYLTDNTYETNYDKRLSKKNSDFIYNILRIPYLFAR